MNYSKLRLIALLASVSLALLSISCGQKGPLKAPAEPKQENRLPAK